MQLKQLNAAYHVDVEKNKDLFHRFSLKGVSQILMFNDNEAAVLIEEDALVEKIDKML